MKVSRAALAIVAATALTALAGAGLAQSGSSQSGSPQPVAGGPAAQVKHREVNMKRMGDAAKAIARYVKNEGGTVQDVQAGAKAIREVSTRIVPELFPAGTARGVGDSEAKAEIWQDWARFQDKAHALEQAAAKLEEAAATGDRAAIAPAFGAVGKACAGCHDDFRIQEKKT